MNKVVLFIIISLGLGFMGGFYFQKLRLPKPQVAKQVVVVPSPSPKVVADEKFENIKAEVKLADGKKFTYTQDGKDKTLTDLTGITVWKSLKPSDKPEKTDWKVVKAGDKVQLASEKATGKIVAVLVL